MRLDGAFFSRSRKEKRGIFSLKIHSEKAQFKHTPAFSLKNICKAPLSFIQFPSIMATIGERLIEARKNFGIDIRSASEATKIRSDFLAALEENKPDRIPLADVYKVGFLRIYSKYLKLDSDRMVAEFRTAQSFQTPGYKHSRHTTSTSIGEDSGNASEGGAFTESAKSNGFSFEGFLRNGGVRLIVAALAGILILGLGTFAAIKFIGGDSTVEESRVETPTPDTQWYEFQVISKIPQTVTIEDRYNAPGEEGARLLDNVQLSADRPQILKGRGILLIRDTGGENLEIRFPSLEALRASQNALEPVKFEEADKNSKPFKNNAAFWTANPYSTAR